MFLLRRLLLVIGLPALFIYGPVSAASSMTISGFDTGGFTAAQEDEQPPPEDGTGEEELDASSLPSAFKGVASGGGIVPFVKTPTEVDPMMPSAVARAEFPDTSFGTGYAFDPGLVARSSIALSGGVRVPTEVACAQPGGRMKEEFKSGEITEWNGQIRFGGGAVKASCGKGPSTVTSGYLYNLVFLTAPASQDAEPPGQVAVVAVGLVSVLSTSTLRSEGLVVETIAELKDVNLGALGQVHIDAIRVETRAVASDGSDPVATSKVTYVGGRAGTSESSENPEALARAASAVLAPFGLSVRPGEQGQQIAADKTGGEAKATGLIIEGANTSPQNAPLWGERKVSIALGFSTSTSHLTPKPEGAEGLGEGESLLDASAEESFGAPTSDVPIAPGQELPEAPAPVGSIAGGNLKVSLDWSAFKVKALPMQQSGAAWGGVGLLFGGLALIRRRLFGL